MRETAVTDAESEPELESDTAIEPRPVTILTGSLGAGKTTTLNHLLASSDRDIAVLVNDMGSLNVDADLVDVETTLDGGESRMAELSNGCICCGLQGELRDELFQLAESYAFDHLVIEASGISEPKPIASQLVGGGAVGDRYELVSIVTVVDTPRFAATFDEVAERAGTDGEGRKPLADLAIEQVEFCTTIIANKQDQVDSDTADRVDRLLESLQPEATIHRATNGAVDPTVLLDGQADPKKLNASAGWKQALDSESHDHDHTDDGDDHDHDHAGHDDHTDHDDHNDDHDHVDHDNHNHADHEHDHEHDHGHEHEHDHEHDHGHEHEHDHEHDHGHEHDHAHPPELYGVDSITYQRRRPFHPERFDAWLDSVPKGVVRAKGIVWIAGRSEQALLVSIVGQRSTVEVTGQWIASLPDEVREKYRRAKPDLEWDDDHGDREIRLALLGSDLDDSLVSTLDDSLVSTLDDCLVTDDEWANGLDSVDNPFPQIESEQYEQGPEAPTAYR